MTPEAFGRLLLREGLVADSALPIVGDGDPSPWFVRLLAGAGAWLAALFVYGASAVLATPLLGSAPARAGVGLLACVGCAIAMRLRPGPAGVFLGQLLLATSLAGFLLVLAGASEWAGLLQVSLLAALLAAALLVANPEPIHRQAMALALVAALALAATDLDALVPLGLVFAAAALLLWTTQARWAAAGLAPVIVPVAAAITAGVVLVPAIATEPLLRLGAERGAWPSWLLPAGLAVALAAAVLAVARELRSPASDIGTPAGWPWLALAATAAVAVAAHPAPGVLACLLAWLLAMAAGRGALAGLALIALGWYLVRLYYGLETSLLGKGIALMGTGVVLIGLHFGLRWLSPRSGAAAPARPAGRARRGHATRLQWLMLLAGASLVFGGFNHAVWRKEVLLRDGAVLRLALAPVDPRALMTGDYMALDYAVAAPLARQLQGRDGFAIVVRDEKGVGRLVRAQPAPEPREVGELALRARARGGRVRIGTDAWYFQEGHAKLYEDARFGEFRVGEDGEALLVRMLDESLRPLGVAPFAPGR